MPKGTVILVPKGKRSSDFVKVAFKTTVGDVVASTVGWCNLTSKKKLEDTITVPDTITVRSVMVTKTKTEDDGTVTTMNYSKLVFE